MSHFKGKDAVPCWHGTGWPLNKTFGRRAGGRALPETVLAHLLESTMAAPPMRKRQLGMSMERSSPKYQFCVMFSVLTTSARELGYTCVAARDEMIS